jgi:hypothetical protein
MTLSPRLRKSTLTVHVISSVGLLGAVAAFLILAVAGLVGRDAQTVRAAYTANGLTAWFLIVPLSYAALLTGIIQSLGTKWGLFRHYWVLAKLLLTVLAVIVLLLQMEGITYLAGVAAETTFSDADLIGLRRSIGLHAAGGVLVLLATTILSVCKPRGMTRYGWRKQNEARAALAP